jgi:Protein of unknown function (DUF1553)/Protein of unknown function (DUF1549)/Planctomycete cytochrome C
MAVLLAGAAGLLARASVPIPTPATAAEERAGPSLDRDVVPILKAHCLKCHGPIKPKGKLNLGSPRAMARGGASGPAIVPGQPDESVLWDQVSGGEMPPEPEEPLSGNEKEVIRRWIERGAEGLPDAAEAARTPPGSDHWAFAPPSHPLPPAVRDGHRVRGPVDRFIQRALEDRGLTLGPDADRATMIRRLTFDLTGLPPSPAEIAAFVDDPGPDAYERLVDRLLASPHYGERWGKHWLDASGYADSNGYFSADTDRPLAYRYRDYVIRSFNADRALDQVVREGLAGDELDGGRRGPGTPPEVVGQLVATHFLRNSQDGTGESDGNPDEVRADKYAVLEGTAQVIGSSLLGLTIQCARCHDHKFEPMTQEDYYRLQAILYPAFNVEHWVKPNERAVVAGPRAELLRWEANEKAIDAELVALRRSFLNGSEAEKKAKAEALKPAIAAIEARRRPNPGRIAGVLDVSADPPEIPILVRGSYSTPGRAVGPGVPAFLADPDNRYEPDPASAGPGSTGRRLALARWLTRPGSRPAALLARVLANRIWQDHFGTGLVATPENLGYTGSTPSHPELLEFLAAELARSGWSAKAMHRMIVTSTAYRQSSAPRPEAARADPDNRLLARYPLRRLDAESIRDAMLAASGELDDRPGGPYVPTHRTDSGEVAVDPTTPGATRRSVYLQHRRTQLASLLEVFDAPSIVATCTRRQPSTVPLQSLSLLNSDFVAARAARLVDRLGPECDHCSQDDARIERAFLLVTGRLPTGAERNAAGRFLREQPARYPGRDAAEALRRAYVDFCQMLLASNAFLYVE